LLVGCDELVGSHLQDLLSGIGECLLLLLLRLRLRLGLGNLLLLLVDLSSLSLCLCLLQTSHRTAGDQGSAALVGNGDHTAGGEGGGTARARLGRLEDGA